MIAGTRFPEGAWDPLFKAAAIAASFAATPDWPTKCDPGPPDDSDAALRKDEEFLLKFVSDGTRADAALQAEIKAQASDFTPYWANLLSCSPSSRPETWSLVLIALQVGGLVVAYYKLKYERARPAQVWTAINPSIPTPSHPSYPNGHALQSRLIAECVKLAVPALAADCDHLAEQIALNRERAGVHFPSDARASLDVAAKVLPILRKVPQFKEVLDAAAEEWSGARIIQKSA